MSDNLKQAMKIVKLNIQNVMRIKTAEITPKSSMVVLSGENDQGKTSILDSISMAIGGKKSIPDEPLRRGEEKGFIETDLGNLVITRRFTKKNQSKGGALTIKSKDGSKYGQQILEELYSSVCFDPEEFMQKKNKDKVEILKEITGLDFTEIDNDRATHYDDRQNINRRIKELEAVIGDKQIVKAPEEELSLKELMDEQKRREDVNEGNEHHREKLEDWRAAIDEVAAEKIILEDEIKDIEQKLKELKVGLVFMDKDIVRKNKKIVIQNKLVADLVDLDIKEVQTQMLEIEETNRTIRNNAELKENQTKLSKLETSSEKETNAIHKIDADKVSMLESARMPIAGLSFDNDQVFYQDIPIEQLSDSDEIRVCMAIAMALNPFIRVILIRKGSLIDKKKRVVIREMAEEYGYQIWLEVTDQQQGTIIIHDGEVNDDQSQADS